jgi:hypothetical protein|tara:strand:- start:153 stop:311 length:159 start_codon:yes stop_codon:yes gene_type:complete
MPSIKLDNGVTAEELDAAIAADNGTPAPAPVKEAPAPKAKAPAKTETPKTSE